MESVEDMPMNIRENMEQRELELLSPYAAHSGHSRGRERIEEECDVRTVYQRDRDRILHCKAFRRMKDKTQVFLAPQGDHYRNRLTHTLEVAQIARTISRGLNLNEDLTEAIALGHDLGHTPFGHNGEEILNKIGEAGIVGMGGAGFPTRVKLSPKEPDKIDYIIANCAECEPYITADYRRMLENPELLVEGMLLNSTPPPI